jgi:coenzyme F420 hydrogenase subunit beta
MKNVNPATSEIRVCDSRADILNSIGSKYCPVHLGENLCGLLGKSPRRGLKAIFVGLPCQIESIRKAERALPGLAKSIPLKIGLYCGNLPSALATRYILKTNRITDEDVSSISYRDSHWPGSMIIRLKNGSRVTLPFLQYWNTGFGQFFARIRCLVCADHTSELADLSLADPWVRLGRKPAEKKGQTVVISRTSAGEEYLRQASQAGYIHLEECSLDEVIQQGTVFKKRNMRSLPARLLLFPSRTPSRYEYPLPMDAASLWWIFCSRIGGFLAGNESLWPLLRLFSSSLFRGSVKSRKTEVNASIDA